MTDPLPRGQQILLQRLMAEHSMTDERCQEIIQDMDSEDLGNAKNLSQIFSSINRQLTRGFGLEIASMVDDSDKTQGKNSSSNSDKKYHVIINQHADEVAKASFSQIMGPAERHYFRIILETLVEGPAVRSLLINLRTDLKDPLKMELTSAEKFIETLLEEHWLSMVDAGTARRESMNAKIQIGPRSYLELAPLLTDLGYEKENLPQFFFYR